MEEAKGKEIVRKILDYTWDLLPEESQECASNRYSVLLSALITYLKTCAPDDYEKNILQMCDDIKTEVLAKMSKNDDKNKS